MEGLNSNLQKKWENKLTRANMPAELGEKIIPPKPKEKIHEEMLSMLSEAVRDVLAQYSKLPPKIQQDILEDVYARNEEGLPFTEIAIRVKTLVKKGKELLKMKAKDSDKHHRPKPSFEKLKLNGETKKLIKELEKIQKEQEEKEEKKNHPDIPKEPPEEEWVN